MLLMRLRFKMQKEDVTTQEKMKQARKLQATLVRNYDPLTDSLTGVKCRATSVAKNLARKSNFRKAEKKASYDFAHVL